jgi:hypothetical protein
MLGQGSNLSPCPQLEEDANHLVSLLLGLRWLGKVKRHIGSCTKHQEA